MKIPTGNFRNIPPKAAGKLEHLALPGIISAGPDEHADGELYLFLKR